MHPVFILSFGDSNFFLDMPYVLDFFYCSSNANPPFWIPIHIVIPERPTESTVFNVIAGNVYEIILHDTTYVH